MSTEELVIRFPVYTLVREVNLRDADFKCGLSPLLSTIETGDGSFRAIFLFTDREGAEQYMHDSPISKPVCLVKMSTYETAKAFLLCLPSSEVDRVILDPRPCTNLRTWTVEDFVNGFEDM